MAVTKQNKRVNSLLHLLKQNNASSIKELADALKVSEMTVRRDVQILAESGLVRIIHGGVIYNPGKLNPEVFNEKSAPLYHLLQEETKRVDEKRLIGEKAAQLIKPNDIIIIDSGSTTDYLVKNIPPDMPLTVICWATNILAEAQKKQNWRIIFAGGYYHENTMMCESEEGVELIKKNRANKAFFAAGGVHPRLGVTNTNQYAVSMKRASITASLERILLVDSSKFGDIRPAYYAELEDFHAIITDRGITEDYRKVITGLGIELIVV